MIQRFVCRHFPVLHLPWPKKNWFRDTIATMPAANRQDPAKKPPFQKKIYRFAVSRRQEAAGVSPRPDLSIVIQMVKEPDYSAMHLRENPNRR